MKQLNYTNQKTSDEFWIDEKGNKVPRKYLSKSNKLMEKSSGKLLKEAIRLNTDLEAFKEFVGEMCQEVYETYMAEVDNNSKEHKGNFTFHNFDRSIKIEVAVHERIEFDDLTIKACKDKLDEFLSDNVSSKDEMIKQMVLDAFETSRGSLDSKKVMSLLRYESKVINPVFQQAMKLLKDSIRRPSSKKYFRVWAKDEAGQYQNIDLNFSSL